MAIFKLPTISLRKKHTVSSDTSSSSTLSPEAATLGAETLTQLIEDKLQRISGDEFLVIKINRQGLLVLGGLLLIILWIAPLVETGYKKITSGEWSVQAVQHAIPPISLPFKKQKNTPSPTPLAQPAVPAPEATASAIRVRMGNNSLEAATSVKALLTSSGFNQVDIIYDAQIDPTVVMVATQSGTNDLGPRLVQLFSDKYAVASAAAVLTSDSNFAATVLIGKNSLRK